MRVSSLFLTLVSLTVAASGVQAQFSYDFNTSQADVNSKFTAAASLTTWSATGGVGNSGWLTSAGGVARTSYYNTPQSTLGTVGNNTSLSLDFKGRNPSGNSFGGLSFVSLGISVDTSSTLLSGSGNFLAVTLNEASSGSTTMQLVSRNGAGTVVVGNSSNTNGTATANINTSGTTLNSTSNTGSFTVTNPTFTMTDNDWYRVTFDIARANSSYLVVNANIFDTGADGTASPTQIGGVTNMSIQNSMLLSASSLYDGFYQLSQSGGGTYGVDNFAAVPEPPGVAFGIGTVVAGLVCIGLRLRRTAHPLTAI